MTWLNIAVIPKFSWPNVPIEIRFDGQVIVMSPPTEKLACRLALFDQDGVDIDAGGTVLSRFLSRMAWANNAGVSEVFFSGTNNPTEPGRLGAGSFGRSEFATAEPPRFIYVPVARSSDAELALALYREALSLNSVPFALLSYFKILNIRLGSGAAQEAWIDANLDKISCPPAVDRKKLLLQQHSSVGHYLYVQGRCAVAHANNSPLVDPDLYRDKRRMQDDLPLVKELAALFIEQELGVQSTDSFHRLFNGDPTPELLVRCGVRNGRKLYEPFSSPSQLAG